MNKYGPGSTPSSLKGVLVERDAADVQEFIVFLKEQRAHFGVGIPNEADQFYDALASLLDEFAQSQAPEVLRDNGKAIVLELSTFSAVIKSHVDRKHEAVH